MVAERAEYVRRGEVSVRIAMAAHTASPVVSGYGALPRSHGEATNGNAATNGNPQEQAMNSKARLLAAVAVFLLFASVLIGCSFGAVALIGEHAPPDVEDLVIPSISLSAANMQNEHLSLSAPGIPSVSV